MSKQLAALTREMRSPDSITDLLETNRWVRELDWNNIGQLARFLHFYWAKAGQKIFSEHDDGAYLCLIVEGKVEISKSDQQDKARKLVSLGPGQAFGEMALIDTRTGYAFQRSATATATEATNILVLDTASFENLCLEFPDLGLVIVRRIARDLSARLRQSSDLLVDYLHE
jgi:CRP-like cAMP-binding protein